MHKRLRLTPLDRQKIWRLHQGLTGHHDDACAEVQSIKAYHLQGAPQGATSGVFTPKVNK